MNTLKTNLPALRQRPLKKPSLPAWQAAALFLTTLLAPSLRLSCFPLKRRAVLANLLALCLLCPTIVPAQSESTANLGAAAEQFFFVPQIWARELTAAQGWGAEHPRMLADVNGDRKQDIVGFGFHGVWFATSTGFGFSPAFVLADFGYQSAWRAEKHVRLLADVNGDGRKDIVAFGNDGVWLALATSTGFFFAPGFVIADFGFNQGWTAYHIRTTADVNGDGRQEIVAFGDDGVWIALSTGTGFSAPRFVLADFGNAAGNWNNPLLYPRLLADINNDGKQDIVGFGREGVWIARSTGSGFAAAQLALADFGTNQRWGFANYRFMADLNSDGYQDIVGLGPDMVYRALGGPNGLSSARGMLRDLRFPYIVPSQSMAPAVGDIDADGMQDLVVFDLADIKVARSSNLPPLPPPAAPNNLRITHTTPTSLTIEWDDNSHDERHFFVRYNKVGSSTTQEVILNADAMATVLNSLSPNTAYCYNVRAENLWGFSAQSEQVCGSTAPEPPVTTSISMSRQHIGPDFEFVSYRGAFGPVSPGARVSNIKFPTQVMLLVKSGRTTNDCGDPNAVVRVFGDLTAAQKIAIWGMATPVISGQRTLPFVGCTANGQTPSLVPVSITWTRQ